MEYLPGQFDQRADSAEQCIRFIKEDEEPVVRTAMTYVIEGTISEEELSAVRNHCINPVDSREAAPEKPDTLVTVFDEPADIITFDGFKDMPGDELEKLYNSLGLAMTFQDFLHIQKYFCGEEHRDPTMTEIRVLSGRVAVVVWRFPRVSVAWFLMRAITENRLKIRIRNI